MIRLFCILPRKRLREKVPSSWNPFPQIYRASPYMTVLFAVIFLPSYLLFRAFSLYLQKREGIWKLHLKR